MKTTITNLLNPCATPTSPFGLLMVICAFLFFNTTVSAQGNGQYTLGPTTPGTVAHNNYYNVGVTPFACGTKDTRNQYLYFGDELTAQLAVAGYITSLAFYVTNLPDDLGGTADTKIYHVNVGLGLTAATTLTGAIEPTTNYLSDATLTITSTGWVTIDLTTIFPLGFWWNPALASKNIVVDICQNSWNRMVYTDPSFTPNNFEVQTSTFPSGGGTALVNNNYYQLDPDDNTTEGAPGPIDGCAMTAVSPFTTKDPALVRVRPDIQFTFACTGTPSPTGTTVCSAGIDYCIGSTNTLSVSGGSNHSGLNYQWRASTDGITYNDILGATSRTYNAVKADVDMWYLRRTACVSNSDSAPIFIGQKTWNGSNWVSNSIIVPAPNSLTESAVFDGNYNSTGDLLFCSMVVKSGNVVIKGYPNANPLLSVYNSVRLDKDVQVLGGSLTFENNTNLKQIKNVVNTGSVNFIRNTTPVRRYDYTYWSSPVAGQTLVALSPLTLADKFYSYNNGWVQENSASSMIAAKGYIIRAPQTYSTTLSSTYTANFAGVPNNGNISINVPPLAVGPSNMYFVGNPYPSGLNADAFLLANSAILTGTIYLWTHNTLPNNNYVATDYASYNRTGGVGIASTSPSQPGGADNFTVPNGRIAYGQGFMAKSAGPGGTIQFTNAMRYDTALNLNASSNDQFFKMSDNASTTVDENELTIEKNRLWLDLTNETGAYKQILIGYITGATMDYEGAFDADNIYSTEVNLFSIIDNHQLVIQGRALPFENTDTIVLGFTATVAGNHTITLPHVDGLFEAQDIYLHDTYLNVITNLKLSNYTFTAAVGTFLDRFKIVYTDATLGVNENILDNKNIIAFKKNGSLVVNAGITNIQSVKVYDLSGRLLAEKSNCNATNVVFDQFNWNAQLLLLQITTEDKTVVTRKVLF